MDPTRAGEVTISGVQKLTVKAERKRPQGEDDQPVTNTLSLNLELTDEEFYTLRGMMGDEQITWTVTITGIRQQLPLPMQEQSQEQGADLVGSAA